MGKIVGSDLIPYFEQGDRTSPVEGQITVERALKVARIGGYNAAIRDAAKAVGMEDREGRDWIQGSLWGELTGEAQARVLALTVPKTKQIGGT